MLPSSQANQPLPTEDRQDIVSPSNISESELQGNRRNGGGLDERDIRLISLLEADPRASLAELARALSLSPQSVSERVKRLEDVGVLGFSVALDPGKLGLSLGAYIRISPAMGELSRVAEIVKTIPEIVECHRITGEDCFIAKVFVEEVGDLEHVIDQLLPYARTNTSIIQSSPVPQRLPKYA